MTSPQRRHVVIDPSIIPSPSSTSPLPNSSRFETYEFPIRPDSVLLPPPTGSTNGEDEIEVPRISLPQHGQYGVGYYGQEGSSQPTSPRRMVNPLESMEGAASQRPTSQVTEMTDLSMTDIDSDFSTDVNSLDNLPSAEEQLYEGTNHGEELFQGRTIPRAVESARNTSNSSDNYIERICSVTGSSVVGENEKITTNHVYQSEEAPMFAHAASRHDEPALNSECDTTPQSEARHYNGCMLYSPLPSPGSSISSPINERYFTVNQSAGPPPDEPLPELDLATRPPCRHRGTEFNPLKPFLEGQVATRPCPADVSGQSSRPTSAEPIVYENITRIESLGTLTKRTEENHGGSSNQPQTAETSWLETSHGNRSESSLIHVDTATYNEPRSPPKAHTKSLNPFKWLPALACIQEFPSRSAAWLGIFNRGEQVPPPPVITPLTELEQNRHSTTPTLAHTSGTGKRVHNPHPGTRRDTPGVDGSYEMVDLGPAPPQLRGLSRDSVELLRDPPEKVFTKELWFKIILPFLIFIGALLTIVIPATLVGFPTMAQRAVNNVDLNVTSFSLTGAQPKSVIVRMDVSLTGSKSNAWVQPANLKLLPEDNFINKYIKDPDTPLGKTSNKKGAFGYLQIAEKFKVGKGVMTPVQLLGENSGSFSISDIVAWGDLVEGLIFQKGVKAVLEGEVQIKASALKATCDVQKTIVIPGISGFGISVIDYQILQNGKQNFTASLDLVSNSSITLGFNNVDFDLILGKVIIGVASIQNFTVKPGNNDLEIIGLLDKELLGQDPILYGELLSVLYINNPSFNKLVIRGKRSTIRGEEIFWLSKAVEKLEIPLPSFPPGPEMDIIKGFGMELSLAELKEGPVVSDGNVSTILNLPFPSNGLSTIVRRIGYSLDLSVENHKFAHLEIPISPSVADQQQGKVFANFLEANLTISNLNTYGELFLRPILQEGNFTIKVNGNLTAELETQIGNATVKEITLPQNSWEIRGYEAIGKGNTVKIRDIELFAHKDGLLMLAKMYVRGTGSSSLNLGTVHFNTGYGANNDVIGTLTIPSFSITKGSNILEVTILIPPKTSTTTLFNKFLSQYMSGGEMPLKISAIQDKASTIPHIASAFKGIEFLATLQTPTHLGFLNDVELYLSKQDYNIESVESELTFVNLFKIPMSIEKLDLQVTIASSSFVIGHINKDFTEHRWVSPGESQSVTTEFAPGVIGIEGIKKFLGAKPREMKMNGTAVVRWSEFNATIVIDIVRSIALRI